jgi:hypothetical protein
LEEDMNKVIVTTWVICIMLCVAFVKLTKVGPTIFTISAENGWGVHSGDFLILVPVVVAIIVTVKFKTKK